MRVEKALKMKKNAIENVWEIHFFRKHDLTVN